MTEAPLATESQNRTAGVSWRRAVLIAGALLAVAAVILLGRQVGGLIPRFGRWVDGLGWWGPLAFIAGYAVATVAFVPGSALTLVAGAIFGLFAGTVYAFLGASLGAAAAFLVARYLARTAIEAKLAEMPRFAAIDRAVGREGGKIVALLRLSPLFPFNLLNYALGLTDVRLISYLPASFAMLPGTLLYVYYGKVGGDVAAAAGGASEKRLWEWLLLGIGLVATAAVTALITRRAQTALGREVGGDEP